MLPGMSKSFVGTSLCILCCLYAAVLWPTGAAAAPPHPDLVARAANGEQALPYYSRHIDQLHAAGVSSGKKVYETSFLVTKGPIEAKAQVTGDFNILAILVQFSDNAAATPAVYFDSLLYDTAGVTLRDYYRDCSYGQLDLVTVDLPSSRGWIEAPETYAYYVNNESGVNPASYPRNSQGMVEDLVDLIDPIVDFSRYDNDGNGFVDVLVVMHAGPGAEKTGLDTDMHSHQWGIPARLTDDGVYVSSFTVQPEYIDRAGDMTIGVIAHELGHAFGLPDLYDTDYSSSGIGKWGIMGYGTWLGPASNGGVPAHPCAWSRIEMGFASSTTVSENVQSQAISDVKAGGELFCLRPSEGSNNEYFLVENRQKTGYDSYLPGAGLLIWHIDESRDNNNYEWQPGLSALNHYKVALEQADGRFDLEQSPSPYYNYGDAGDVWPGSSGAVHFNALSTPNSDSYSDSGSLVGVGSISAPAAVMYADFNVSLVAGGSGTADNETVPRTLELAQNYPNPFNPSTSISFYSSAPGMADLEVFDVTGRKVRTLLHQAVIAGDTELTWDGLNDAGNSVSSGVYLYRLEINDRTSTRKMVLVR